MFFNITHSQALFLFRVSDGCVQIYCVLIVNLLLAVIKKRLKRHWAFSNLVSFCKIHLFNYINLMKFLENPEKDWVIDRDDGNQLSFDW
ncbi:hypothetical protein [Daejeonia sp. YH14]|uniref:hypothetical protein n=1 Tax=Daejeonia sp. YH14 TaxID=3439042 RepID=UPI003F49AD99